jgi:hypothetical protein
MDSYKFLSEFPPAGTLLVTCLCLDCFLGFVEVWPEVGVFVGLANIFVMDKLSLYIIYIIYIYIISCVSTLLAK